jgi:hypothetical protein
MLRTITTMIAVALFCGACGEEVSGPGEPAGSYWPAQDKTFWRWEGGWRDLSGKREGGAFAIETIIAGTTYDSQGRPVKIWRTYETDGDYYFRVAGDEIWTNWTETDPKAPYYLWLKLPPANGQYWEDDRHRVSVKGPLELDVPFGAYGDVYRARYEYVQEPGRYEVWWYAAGVGCIKYEHYLPGEKHELVELAEFRPGG